MMTTERWLALPAHQGARLLGQHHDDDELDAGQGEAARGQAEPARLRRHHLRREAHVRRGRDGRGLGRLVRSDHREDIKFVVPEEGSDLWTDTMVVLKGSKNKEAALAFINLMLDPEMHAWVAQNVYYNVPNEAA